MAHEDSGWTRFWNAGTWWKAFLLLAVYLAIYELIVFAISSIFSDAISDDPLGNAITPFLNFALPVLVGGILLMVFVRSVGWQNQIFSRQRVQGKPWMWVAVVVTAIPIVMHLVATRWSAYSVTLILSVLFLGVCVGFTEELATRGIAVNMLRNGGYGEKKVFILSSLAFGLLHSGNLLLGQNPTFVAVTVIFAVGFGAMMYLAMRVTGSIVWAMVLHGATDPATILATGGIDSHSDTTRGDNELILYAGLFQYAYFVLAILAIFLVKGHADRTAAAQPTRA